jgi:F-type H+-transporting ATPase subunit delta
MERQIAARYAEALFGVLQEREIIDQGLADLRQAEQAIEGARELRAAIQHPELPAAAKRELLEGLLGGQVGEAVLVFLTLLTERRRYPLLPHVIEEVERLANEARNILPVEVVSAVPLTEQEQARLAAALSRRTGRRVRLAARLDPEVLAGVWLRMDDEVIDGTARWRLEQMRRAVHEIELQEQADETAT